MILQKFSRYFLTSFDAAGFSPGVCAETNAEINNSSAAKYFICDVFEERIRFRKIISQFMDKFNFE
jgi:hypothetical protein